MSAQDYNTSAASNSTIDGVDVAENCAFSGLNNAIRSLMADIAQYIDDVGAAATSSGTDTITLTTAQTLTAYADGTKLVFIAGGTNTGAATLNVDSVGAKAVVRGDGSATALSAGDITAGMPIVVFYDASVGAGSWLLLNPLNGFVSALNNVVEDTTPQLGGALDGQGNDITGIGVLTMVEQAAAEADVAGRGQFWVQTATPNIPMFTDDAGTDAEIAVLDGVLQDLDTLGAPSADSEFIVATGAGAFAYESGATVRTSLGLTIGTDVQAQGAVLDDFNTLGAAASDGEMIVATGAGAFAYESGATLRTSIGVGTGDTPQFTGIEVGHATDTTLTRDSAGVVAVEGSVLAFREPNVNAQTGTTYTLALTDGGSIVTMSNASANTLTITANASVAFPTDTVITVIQKGAGATTVQGGAGVTVNGVSTGGAAIDAQYAAVTLLKVATDTWIMSGAHGTVA